MSSFWTHAVAAAVAATATTATVTFGVVTYDPTPNTSTMVGPSSSASSPAAPTVVPVVPVVPVPTDATDVRLQAETEAKAHQKAQARAEAKAAEKARVEAEEKARLKAREQRRAEARAKEARQERKAAERKARRKARAVAEELRKNPPVQYPFTVASFNALGSSHTEGQACNRCDWADTPIRTRWATEVFRTYDLDVVGLQEFQPPQQQAFSRLMPNWAFWGNSDNHVAWDKTKFSFVSGTTFTIPYFGGSPREMPVVRLRSVQSGQEMVFISVHNPADTRGNAQRWRDEATRREVAVVADLRNVQNPAPVFMLGDTNERENFYCAFTASQDMHHAGGGTHDGEVCTPPVGAGLGIDWVFGSTGVEFSGFARLSGGKIGQATDHPLVLARVG